MPCGKLKDKKNKHLPRAKDEVLSLAPSQYVHKHFIVDKYYSNLSLRNGQ
jgi:hypothetical protein